MRREELCERRYVRRPVWLLCRRRARLDVARRVEASDRTVEKLSRRCRVVRTERKRRSTATARHVVVIQAETVRVRRPCDHSTCHRQRALARRNLRGRLATARPTSSIP